MNWGLVITSRAKRQLHRLSTAERKYIDQIFGDLCDDPFVGDVKFLRGTGGAMRRRVGDWRIIYDLHESKRLIVVTAVTRRASNTY